MGLQNPFPNWSDPELLAAIEQAFDATWPVNLYRQSADG